MKRHSWVGLLLLASVLPLTALGQQSPRDVRIDISKGSTRIPILIEPLAVGGDPQAAGLAQEVLANDLDMCGVFDVSRSWGGAPIPQTVQAIVGGKWTSSGREVRLQGEVRDFPARRPILTKEYRGAPSQWRWLVHQFADDIVLQFTGVPGVARTRVAFASPHGREKELYVMDLDGANLRPLTTDHSIALSPAWSPDGSLLLFTSYRGGGGLKIYLAPATGGKVYLISGRAGNNTSPAYAPDGQGIACTLSQDGNPEIYLLDARGGAPRRLTTGRAIDTSPSWSPTGQNLAFTSDRDGTPQVYVMDASGGNVRRLTYDVTYTDSPAWSPNGETIAFVSRTGGGFDILVCKADGTGLRTVASGGSNENPRWSPDSRHLVFASNREGGYALYVSDLDDRAPRKLDTHGMPAMSPAWSPRLASAPSP